MMRVMHVIYIFFFFIVRLQIELLIYPVSEISEKTDHSQPVVRACTLELSRTQLKLSKEEWFSKIDLPHGMMRVYVFVLSI